MKPAPATSARATSALAGSAATMAAASSRGFLRAGFASRSATLVANSPCCASRVRSTLTAAAGGISGSTPPASFLSAVSSSCSSSCFKVVAFPLAIGAREFTRSDLSLAAFDRC